MKDWRERIMQAWRRREDIGEDWNGRPRLTLSCSAIKEEEEEEDFYNPLFASLLFKNPITNIQERKKRV